MNNIYAVYFSATDTTRRYADALAAELNMPVAKSVNIADGEISDIPKLDKSDLLILAAPVYGGRIPDIAANEFRKLAGTRTAAIPLAIYGNRDYDDALLELSDILEEGNFRILGAGAFIACHSIFPKVAAARPDADDFAEIRKFAERCRMRMLDSSEYAPIHIKGNRPYKQFGGVPLHPDVDVRKCTACGTCVEKCPVGAIPSDDPTTSDPQTCISCGRCIHHCAAGARKYSGLKYKIVGKTFAAANARRKDPEWTVAD